MDALDLDGPNPWQTTEVRVVFDDGRLRLHEDLVVQPDGVPGRYTYLEVLEPIVTIVALDDAQCIYLVRQWRYPWRRNSWELPSGGGERHETPLEAAQRELGEEVGLHANDWELLQEAYSSATIDSHWHIFLARDLHETTAHQRDGAEQDLVAQRIPMRGAVEAAMDGRIHHGMSIAAILCAARRLGI
jgi:8-oxo-dGDP phosphatase